MANTLKFGSGQWGTKVGSALAYNDEGGNFKPLPFNFTRSTSGTRVNKEGLIEVVTNNKPRIDFLNDSNGALLLEPARTNLITYSQSVIDGWVSSSNITRTDNQAISPDGAFTSGHITSTSDSSYGSIRKTISVSANSTYTISLFVKKEVSETYYMGVGFVFSGGTTDVGYGIIDAVNGTGYSADPSIPFTIKVDDYGTYWRFSFTGTDSGSNNSLVAYIYSTLSKNGTSVEAGLGSTRTIWGAQLEAGSYATSYIPTQGAISTKVAEVCNDAGNSQIFNDSEGVLYAEINTSFEALNGVKAVSVQYDGNNYVAIYFRDNNKLSARVVGSGNVTQVDADYTTNIFYKIAVSYNSTNVKFYVNGIQVDIDTTNTTPTLLNKLSFDRGGVATTNMEGKVRSVKYFPTALNDEELENLTTI